MSAMWNTMTLSDACSMMGPCVFCRTMQQKAKTCVGGITFSVEPARRTPEGGIQLTPHPDRVAPDASRTANCRTNENDTLGVGVTTGITKNQERRAEKSSAMSTIFESHFPFG